MPRFYSEPILQDQHTDKYFIKWDNISDDRKTIDGDIFDDLAIEMVTDVLTCSLSFCDEPSDPIQLDYIYSASVESLHLSASPPNKRTKHRGRQIPG